MTTAKPLAPRSPARKSRAAAGDLEQRRKRAQARATRLKHASDPTRISVLLMLAEGERHVGALCAALDQSQPAVSHHLALLRHGGIIARRRQGKNNFYSLTAAGGELTEAVKALLG